MNKEFLKAYIGAYVEVYVKPDIKILFTPIQHEVVLPDSPEESSKSGVVEITDEASFIHEKRFESAEDGKSENGKQ